MKQPTPINRVRGERRLATADGDTVRLLMTHNALALLEDATGRSVMELVSAVDSDRLGISDIRAMVWAAAEGYRRKFTNDGAGWTLEAIGDLMDDAGFEASLEAATETFAAAFGDDSTVDTDGGEAAPADPPKGGTGTAS